MTAMQLDDFTMRIPDHLVTTYDIGIAQTHLTAGNQALEFP